MTIRSSNDQWVFEVKVTAKGGVQTPRSQAWDKCREAGTKVGIPNHAWRKDHDGAYWRWVTAPRRELGRQESALRRQGILPPETVEALDSDHLTGAFNQAIDRAVMLLSYGQSRAETCHVLAPDVGRETAFFAVVAAALEMEDRA